MGDKVVGNCCGHVCYCSNGNGNNNNKCYCREGIKENGSKKDKEDEKNE